MDLYFIRHGESTGNTQKCFMGWSDHPLSSVGQLQAEAVANRLASLGPMPVISSDLLRTRQTASLIAAKWGGEVVTDCRWREINFGILENHPWDELTGNSELTEQMENDPINTSWPQGESIAMVIERVKEAYIELLNRNDERICIVAHGGPIHSVVAHCLQIPSEKYWTLKFANAGLTHIRIENGWTSIVAINDTCHL